MVKHCPIDSGCMCGKWRCDTYGYEPCGGTCATCGTIWVCRQRPKQPHENYVYFGKKHPCCGWVAVTCTSVCT